MLEDYKKHCEEREEMGKRGLEHVKTNYGFDKFKSQWVEQFLAIHEEHGSWENRKNYKSWELLEL